MNDLFFQIAKGMQESACSFVGYHLGQPNEQDKAREYHERFQNWVIGLAGFTFVSFAVLLVVLRSYTIQTGKDETQMLWNVTLFCVIAILMNW